MRPARGVVFAVVLVPALALAVPPAREALADPRGTRFRVASLDTARHLDVNLLDLGVSNLGWIAVDGVNWNGGLEYPSGSGKSVIFAAGLWVGALVAGEPRVTVAEYSTEWRPGRIFGVVPEPPTPSFLRAWKVRTPDGWRAPPDSARVLAAAPAVGDDELVHDAWRDYVSQAPLTDAPVRAARLPNPASPGDSESVPAPDLPGDLATWATFNDADPAAHDNDLASSLPLGIEVRQTVFAFESMPRGVAFVRWKLFHRGASPLDSAYVTFWVDPDLGSGSDDLVGWDPALQMGFAYNATNADNVYGARPPAVGIRFLSGPGGTQAAAFNKYIGGNKPEGPGPTYGVMRGLDLAGDEWIDPTTLQPTRFPFAGDPVAGTGWLDAFPADRRFLVSSGPFHLDVGDSAEFLFAVVVGWGYDRIDSIERLRCQARLAAEAADSGFVPLFPARIARTEAIATPTETRFTWRIEGAHPRELDVRTHPGAAVVPWPDGSDLVDRRGVDATGHLRFVDIPPEPGARVTYGLFDACDPLVPLDQATVVGVVEAFSLRVTSPVSELVPLLFVTIPRNGPGRLEAFAIDGRRMLDHDLGLLSHGTYAIPVPGTAHWRSGLYVFRLTHGGASRTTRVVFAR